LTDHHNTMEESGEVEEEMEAGRAVVWTQQQPEPAVSKSIYYTDTSGEPGEWTEDRIETRLLPSSVSTIAPKSKNVSCQHCSYTTNRRSHLNEHYRIIHLKVKVVCDLCGKEFSNINQHMRVVHKVLRSGILVKKECEECHKEFFDLTKHMAKAHNLKYVYDYDCSICSTKFKSKFILQRHMQRKHGDKSGCDECGKKVSNLDVHIKKVHKNRNSLPEPGELRNPCSTCDSIFKTEEEREKHSPHCPGRKEQPDLDGEVSDDGLTASSAPSQQQQRVENANYIVLQQAATQYENLHSEAGAGHYQAEVSSKLGSLKSEPQQQAGEEQVLTVQISMEDDELTSLAAGQDNQNFMACQGYRLGVEPAVPAEPPDTKQVSAVRLQTKEGKKSNFQCELCGYATNRATNYNMHYKMVHLKSRTQCELCGKEYSNINQHMRVVHKVLKSGMTEKHKCSQCDQEYYDIQQHMRRAHKQLVQPRDCTCSTCGEKFTKFANMKRHQQRVHQGLRVTCNVCQKEVSNIDKHRRVHRNRGDKISGGSVMVLNKSQLEVCTLEFAPEEGAMLGLPDGTFIVEEENGLSSSSVIYTQLCPILPVEIVNTNKEQ